MVANRKYLSCPVCKCRTEQGAETKCRPTRDYSDEWTCPMDYAQTDEKGRFFTAHEEEPTND